MLWVPNGEIYMATAGENSQGETEALSSTINEELNLANNTGVMVEADRP